MSVKVIINRDDSEFKAYYAYYLDLMVDKLLDLREDWIHIVVGSNKSEVDRIAKHLAGFDFYIKKMKTDVPFWMAVTVGCLYEDDFD